MSDDNARVVFSLGWKKIRVSELSVSVCDLFGYSQRIA